MKHFKGLERGSGSVWFSNKNDVRHNVRTQDQISHPVLAGWVKMEVSGATLVL